VTAGGKCLLALVLLLSPAGTALAQDSLILVRRDAQVASVGFRFAGTSSFSDGELGAQLAVKGRGSLYPVRRWLGELPLIPSPGAYRFDPVELQKDVVRLRRFYQRSGFIRPRIDYDVRLDHDGALVGIVYLIDEGPWLRLRSLDLRVPYGGSSSTVPPALATDWNQLASALDAAEGRRFGDAELADAEAQTAAWLRERGYPFAAIRSQREVDSTAGDLVVHLAVSPGPRVRFGQISAEGNASVSDGVVLRELPFRSGDWFSTSAVAEGRTRLQSVDLLSRAVVDVDSQPARDSTLGVRIRIEESAPRLTLAEVGYVSEGAGLTGRVQWTHPNFTGGARSLTASVEGQTGAGAIGTEAEQLLRLSLSLTQPYVLTPRLSFTAGPWAEYRNDLHDESGAVGIDATLIYRLAALSSLALGYRFSARNIREYHFGDITAGDVDLLALLAARYPPLIDSLGDHENRSSLTLAASFNRVDHVADPTRGWLIRPSAELTLPSSFNTAEFGRLDLSVSRFHPLSRTTVLSGRFTVGRLFPFGKSIPGPGSDPFFSFIHLRDESMTAGGTNDVRGWGDRKLGPKVPDVEANIEGTDTVLTADRYVPIGALARITGSVELRFPAPGFSPGWQGHLFLDGGRVWTPDERFSQSPLLPEGSPFRFSAGVGLSYQTPVGALGVSMGYKLNPSLLDERDPNDVTQALEAGSSVEDLPAQWLRRVHLHLSFGVAL
jgi:outer membrane protein insertion porin family